jgi:competence protein ComEC
MAALVMATRRLARPLGPPAAELAARWRRQPLSRRAAPVAVLVAVLVLAGGATLAPPSPPTALTVRFLDVGQGDATLIQAPDGAAVLFDGGPPEAGVVDLLRRAGVRRLAVVVATHPSRDHHGGLREVLRSYHVDLLLDGGDGTRDPTFRAVLAEAARRGVRRVAAVPPLTLETGEITIRVLSPPPRPPGPPPEDPNPRGVVTIVSSGAFDLMLSADAESVALLPLALPDVDAMKVPHHGSSDDGLPRVLERLRPEVAAIERHNTYAHPAPSTLAALRRAGVQTYRTDRDGTVTLTVEHGRMRVATER